MKHEDRADRIGAIASTLCAAHCAVCALLPAAFGALGVGFLLGHEAEWAFATIATTVAIAALVLGWRRHRERHVAVLLMLGIAGLLASRGVEGWSEDPWHLIGAALGVLAGLTLVAGHLLNLRASQRCTRGCCQ